MKHRSRWKRLIRLAKRNRIQKHGAERESIDVSHPVAQARDMATETSRANVRDVPAETAMIYQSELDYISRCILDYPCIETGGQLFGFWSASGTPIVVYAIGPGQHANHQITFFNQDLEYLTTLGRILVDKYGLQHMGEWHSHHRLGLAHPSGHDADTMVNSIRKGNLGRFLLCIGNCDSNSSVLNAFTFAQSAGHDYRHAAWRIRNVESPFRTVISADEYVRRIVIDPKTPAPRHGKLFLADGNDCFVTPDYSKDYWLKDRANNLVLKKMMDDLSALAGPCSVQKDERQRVHLAVRRDKEYRFVFPEGFPNAAPLVFVDGVAVDPPPKSWMFTGDIAAAFSAFSVHVIGGGNQQQRKWII